MAQPFLTLMNGSPVSPSTDTDVSALPAASEPPAAKSTSSQRMPASSKRAAGGDGRHLEAADPFVAAERVDPEADDGDVAHPSSSIGRNA